MARTEGVLASRGDGPRGGPWPRRHANLAGRAVHTLLVAICLAAVSAAEPVALTLHEGWTGFFGGAEAVLHVALPADQAATGSRLAWELTVEQRVIARREQTLAPIDAGQAGCDLRFALPPVKEGVIMPVSLTLALLSAAGRGTPAATLSRTLWLFPADPFSGRLAALRTQRLRVFDPEGTTRGILGAAGVPHEAVRDPNAIDRQAPGTLVVAPGVSLASHRGLWPLLVGLAAQGHRVLWLSPAGGEVPLPGLGAETGLPAPVRVSFRGSDVIAELDKRLDAAAWPPAGSPVCARLRLKADRGRVLGEFGSGPDGWPWVAMDFAGQGRLVVCGFAVIERWEAGPTPRFLLARILDWLVENKE